MATKLIDLIEKVNADDLPTNEFSIEDKDPMVILGKLNEVIAYLQTLQATINASDSKANEALQKAIQAVDDATQALSVANGIDAKATQALANAIEAVGTANTALSASNTALSTANTAISTANTALSSANSAVETAEDALGTAVSAETKADTAITTANGAKTTAEGIDAKATTALANSQTAVSTANTAETKAQEALEQVVSGLGTKVYRDSELLTNFDVKPIEENIANNTTAINALDNAKVDKVAGKQLSTEDFTTAEKNKLAGLNNYDDTQVQADITALQNADNVLRAQINEIINKIYPIGSIYISTNTTNPSEYLGGVWAQIKDKFLLASGDIYPNGSTGGESTHTLTKNEMPSHTHIQYSHNHSQNAHNHRVYSGGQDCWSGNAVGVNGNTSAVAGVESGSGSRGYYNNFARSGFNNQVIENAIATNNSVTATNQNTGGSRPHNNMPPYLAVTIWQRIE